MSYTEYISKRDKLIKDFSEDNANAYMERLSIQFNIVSASFSNYLPQSDVRLHHLMYKNILLHQQLSVLEQSYTSVLDHITCENLDKTIWDTLKHKASIICTFHTGSYRVINLFLIRNKIPFSLVIAGNVKTQQGDLFKSLYKQFHGKDGSDELTLIDAESPVAGLQMLKELRKGRNLLIYIDGNTGSGHAADNNNHCLVNFLRQKIFARKGIAFLSHISGSPIITAASYRKSIEDIQLRFFETIYPDAGLDRNIFAEITTQKIYNSFADIVERYPDQWEGWLYIHKSAHITGNRYQKQVTISSGSIAAGLFRFNCLKFGIFKIGDIAFLLRKSNYVSYQIDSSLYDLLLTCISKPLDTKSIPTCLLEQLCGLNIILPA